MYSLEVIGAHIPSAAIAVQTLHTPSSSFLTRVEEFPGTFARRGSGFSWLIYWRRGGKSYMVWTDLSNFLLVSASQGVSSGPPAGNAMMCVEDGDGDVEKMRYSNWIRRFSRL